MKISLAQINTTVGDIRGNTKKIIEFLKKAERQGAALAVFPEAAVTGYPALDLWDDRSLVAANLDALKEIAAATGETACLVGFIGINESGKGKPLMNCAALLHQGKTVAVRAKTLLPTYDVFDEHRYFCPASENTPVSFGGISIGVTICEDIWNMEGQTAKPLYSRDPLKKLLKEKPDLIINLSASPYHQGKPELRKELLRAHAGKSSTPFIYCNQVGGNDELIFDGGSLAINARGEITAAGKPFEEELLTVDFPLSAPAIQDGPSDVADEIRRALVLGIKDFAQKCGFKKAVLGLSGGIDSAVVCALAAEALGPENVTGAALPSPYTSKESVRDAEALARNLGVRFITVPITGIFSAYLSELKPFFAGMPEDTTEQNLQARIRGGILMALSNKLRAMLLSTGNKSEVATGYCTLYGDMCGALNPLSDVPKTTVYAIARNINKTKEIIPLNTIERAPSAELKPNQKDQDDLPPYDIIDTIISSYIEDGKTPSEISGKDIPGPTVQAIISRIDRAEFKRRQAAPGLKITRKAFGIGRKMPIARGYHR